MEPTAAFTGLRCLDCGETVTPDRTHRCPDCGGVLDPTYDETALADAHETFTSDRQQTGSGLAQFEAVLPLSGDQLITLEEGSTPLVSAPSLTDDIGVEDVLVKDEARNPTGALADRGMALAVSVARARRASDVALPTTGNAGQAAAAYASRGGLDSHSFVPSRTTFANKAMINVHGGDMNVIGGRYPDAAGAFESAIADEDWHSLAPFDTPYRHEGAKTLSYELVADLGAAPDAVVCPTGHGTTIVGLAKGFRELAETGTIEESPRLYAAQAGGCAPIATAWAEGKSEHESVEHPDTICGTLEVPDPAGGKYVIDALESTGGAAIGTGDQVILERAVSLADAGVPTSATAGAAISGASALADQGAFDDSDTVVLVNPTTANRESDLLRSHLMGQGV